MPWMSMYQRKRKIRKSGYCRRTQKSQWTALQMNHQLGGGKTGETNAMAATSNGSSRDVTNNKDSIQTVEQTSAGNKDSMESTSNAGAPPSKATKPGTGTMTIPKQAKVVSRRTSPEDNAAVVPTNKSHVPTATVGGSGKG